ncbi:unnamed protein product, partial [Rotaria sp. Silwood1]
NNQFQQSINIQTSSSSLNSNVDYLDGNLSESFSFQVAPSSIKVTYLGLKVSSLQIHNSHVSEDNNGSSLVSYSVSIIRSTFKLPEPSIQSQNSIIKIIDTENLPRLDLFISTRTTISTTPMFSNKKIYNDTLNEQNFTRTITRADHNGTIQCQIESNNCSDIYLIKTVSIGIEYGPNLETDALSTINLEGELKNYQTIPVNLVGEVYQFSIQTPSNPSRPSPMTNTHSSYRQAPSTSISLPYRQASVLPGFRPIMQTNSYSPEHDDVDDISTNINSIPLTINRSRTNTPFGSHKSLSESIQSLRSNQQQTMQPLPIKKRLHDQSAPRV